MELKGICYMVEKMRKEAQRGKAMMGGGVKGERAGVS